MWAFFVISVALVAAATCYMIATLPAKDVPAQVKGVVAWAWLTTFLICSIVPIDVFSTLQSQDPDVILTLWDISYWSTQLLTWLVIPLYMGYAAAGEFTWHGRMWASVRSNTFLALILGFVMFVGAFWAVTSGKLNLSTLPSLAIQLNNTFGLFCVLTLLGYGLVAIPRRLWKQSDPIRELRHHLYRLGRVMDEQGEAQLLLSDTLRKIESTKRALGRSELEAHMRIDSMMQYIHTYLGDAIGAQQPQIGHVEEGVRYTDELPQLHAEVKRDVHWIGAINAQADLVCKRAVHLTEVVKASQGEFVLDSRQTRLQQIKWSWIVQAQPPVLQGVAVAAGVLSAVIVWCNVAVGISSSLSPLYLLITWTKHEFFSQLLTMMLLVYVIVCTFTAFFAINVGSMYALLPGASSSFSLLFNATLAARFAAPLCFNYLHVIGMDWPTADGHYTVFAQRMGLQPGADVAIPFLGVDFNRWAPVMVLAVGALTFFNAFGKFYSWVSTLLPFLPQQFDENDDSELSESQMYVAEGQRVVNRALPRAEAGEMTTVLLSNLAHYTPSRSVPSGGRPSAHML